MNAIEQLTRALSPTHATTATPRSREAQLEHANAEARKFLGAALLWAGPGDDEGVIENVRAALRALERCK